MVVVWLNANWWFFTAEQKILDDDCMFKEVQVGTGLNKLLTPDIVKDAIRFLKVQTTVSLKSFIEGCAARVPKP